MPCNDITELLHIEFDASDRITFYTLSKRTCGGSVGDDALILSWLQTFTTEDIPLISIDQFLNAHPCSSETEEFLYLKHFQAVQTGIAVFLGHEAGRVTDFCVVDSIEYHPLGSSVSALIHIDLLTERIKNCGGCSQE